MCLWYKQGFKMCPLHKLIKEISFHIDNIYGTSLGKKYIWKFLSHIFHLPHYSDLGNGQMRSDHLST